MMKIALAQINPTVGDFAGNSRLILDFAGAGRGAGRGPGGVSRTCGLRLSAGGPAGEGGRFWPARGETLEEIAAQTAGGGPAILCGTALATDGDVGGKHVRNVAALLSGGKVSFVQQKMLLPFYDVFDEQRYFEPAAQQTLTMLGGQPLAITICEDAWNDKGFWPRRLYPVDPVDELMRQWARCPIRLRGASAHHSEYLGVAVLARQARSCGARCWRRLRGGTVRLW